MDKLKIVIITVVLLLFGCHNLQSTSISEKTSPITFEKEIDDLKEINDVKKIFNAWKIDYNNSDLPDNLPHTMKIIYVISTSRGSGIVYYLYTDTYQKIGKLEEKNIDLYRIAILDQDKAQNYIFITSVCDEAFNTNFLVRLADDRYDIKEVAEGIHLERMILENIISQIRDEKKPLEKLN